ncbi:MAG: drug/metabolite exporter YedA [Bacteroidota bacterium]
MTEYLERGGSKGRIVAAFAAVYIIWGSTYLGIRFAIETIPPFLMAGTRFLIAGSVLYAWMRLRGTPGPTREQWKSATIIGALLLLIGNGGVTWAEQIVSSSITALLIATTPLWFVMLDWMGGSRTKPNAGIIAGLVVGTLGVLLLIGPWESTNEHSISLIGMAVLMVATIAWAAGSLYSKKTELPASPLMSTAMQMLAGGALLMIVGFAAGEERRLNPETFSFLSVASLLYLTVFGSLIAFSAYVWLLRVASASRVATYAYVNPVIAVILGWAFAGEELTLRTMIAAAVIIVGVVLIINNQSRGKTKPVALQQEPIHHEREPLAAGETR